MVWKYLMNADLILLCQVHFWRHGELHGEEIRTGCSGNLDRQNISCSYLFSV